jgi:hypothetical protein
METEIMTMKEVAAFLRISIRSVWRLLYEGLPSIQIRKHTKRYFYKSDVVKFYDSHKIPNPFSPLRLYRGPRYRGKPLANVKKRSL